MHQEQSADEMKRTTVSFDDDQYEILEKWADKEIRTVPNLITAIVVGVLRGEPPQLPKLEEDKKEPKL
jgi:CopG-like RHH_1 or ribbon-helix-helix domain, RHH_5